MTYLWRSSPCFKVNKCLVGRVKKIISFCSLTDVQGFGSGLRMTGYGSESDPKENKPVEARTTHKSLLNREREKLRTFILSRLIQYIGGYKKLLYITIIIRFVVVYNCSRKNIIIIEKMSQNY